MAVITRPVNAPNWEKLQQEILATYAGAGVTTYDRAALEQQSEITVNHVDVTEQGLDAIIAAHNPAILTTEQTAVLVQTAAKAQAAAIPSWAAWTEAEALAWHDTNIANALPVANLAAANVVLGKLEQENRALVRMVIALRNQIWSDLQG